MPLPLVPLVMGKVAFAAGAALFAHRLTRRLQRVADYADRTPVFTPNQHLHGVWKGEGVLHGPMGRVQTRLTGWMEGTWLDQHGELRIGLQDEQGLSWSDTLHFQASSATTPDSNTGGHSPRPQQTGTSLFPDMPLWDAHRSPGASGTEESARALGPQDWVLLQHGNAIGKASCAGNTLHLDRRAVLPAHLGGWRVHIDDWFHLLDNDRCMQRATWSKLATPLLDLAITWNRWVPEPTDKHPGRTSSTNNMQDF